MRSCFRRQSGRPGLSDRPSVPPKDYRTGSRVAVPGSGGTARATTTPGSSALGATSRAHRHPEDRSLSCPAAVVTCHTGPAAPAATSCSGVVRRTCGTGDRASHMPEAVRPPRLTRAWACGWRELIPEGLDDGDRPRAFFPQPHQHERVPGENLQEHALPRRDRWVPRGQAKNEELPLPITDERRTETPGFFACAFAL